MKFASEFVTRLGGLGMTAYLNWLRQSVDLRIGHYDLTTDPARPEFAGRIILVFWHEYIAVPLAFLGNCRISMLNSKHRDADWLAEAGHHLGYSVVRGSTKKGGAAAIRELKQNSRDWNLAITPDGPMGPRREFELGAIYLSSRLGVPLVPLGVGYDRPWRLPTWDRFAVPRPYSRVRMIWGPRTQIPPQLDREGLEHYRQVIARVITTLTTDAEQWAESGTRRIGEHPFVKLPRAKPRGVEPAASALAAHRSNTRREQRRAA